MTRLSFSITSVYTYTGSNIPMTNSEYATKINTKNDDPARLLANDLASAVDNPFISTKLSNGSQPRTTSVIVQRIVLL